MVSFLHRYSECISVICAFSKTVSELILEVGEDLTIELSTVRDANPAVWTKIMLIPFSRKPEIVLKLQSWIMFWMNFSGCTARKFSLICK